MKNLNFSIVVALFFLFLTLYFSIFKHLNKKCQELFNYWIGSPSSNCTRIGLTVFCFGYFFTSSNQYIFYWLITLIFMFIRDLIKTNLKYAVILLILNIVGTFAIGAVFSLLLILGMLNSNNEPRERY